MDTTSDLIQRLWFLDILSSIKFLCVLLTSLGIPITILVVVILFTELGLDPDSNNPRKWFLLLSCTAAVTILGTVGWVMTPSRDTIDLQRVSAMDKMRKENLIPGKVEAKEDVR